MRHELLLTGGEVVDPAGPVSGRFDVAISAGRVAAVERAIPADTAVRVIDVSGSIITPGLVDIHTHIYRGAGFYGIDHESVAWRSGVTTWVDAGSAGAYTLAGFREFVVEPAATRVRALVNISAIGLAGPTGEMVNLEHGDVDACIDAVERNREFVVGVKARISTRPAGGNGLESLRRARAVGAACEVPVMVHIGHGPPTLDEVLELLAPGDIVTHCCVGASMRLIDNQGRLRDSARRARDSGVIFDVGHGSSSFSFATAESLAGQGFWPDVISTDLHQRNVFGPVFDLPHCLDMWSCLGMPLTEVVRAATSSAAAAVGLGDVSLRPGQPADIGVFALNRGTFTFLDAAREARHGTTSLQNTLTLVAGRALPVRTTPDPAPWVEISESQAAYIASLPAAVRTATKPVFDRVEDFEPAPSLLPPAAGPRHSSGDSRAL